MLGLVALKGIVFMISQNSLRWKKIKLSHIAAVDVIKVMRRGNIVGMCRVESEYSAE